MNKKEVLEIRKQFTPANCAITRIAGCYVDHEKNKKMESKSAFLSLPEILTFFSDTFSLYSITFAYEWDENSKTGSNTAK